jgi:trk system potassium uptake protein TrkH
MIPVMVLGATNFVLLYHAIGGEPRRLLDNEEFRFYLGILGAVTALVFVLLTIDPRYDVSVGTTRHVLFQVVSIITTTGFASVDFNAWPATTKHVLFLCMFLGGMAGSTTCSIKTLRWLVALKSFRRDLFTAIHPEAIKPIRLSGQVIDEETIRDVYVYVYVLLSIVLFVLATLVVILDVARIGLSLSEFEALSATAATFFNIGPAFGLAGPFENYAAFPLPTKLFMTFLMWMGRIKVVPVLVLFTAAYWQS